MLLKDFEYVTTIADEKSINKASQKLYVAQPSLTKYISRLEKKLGYSIFKRTSTGVTLTELGKVYYEFAHNVMLLSDEYNKKIKAAQLTNESTLKIGASWYVQSYFLSKELNQINSLLSDVMTEYEEASSEKLISEFSNDSTMDIIFVHLLPHEQIQFSHNVKDETLAREEFLIVAPKKYKLSGFDKQDNSIQEISLSLLKNKKIILFKPEQQIRKLTDIVLQKANIAPPTATILHGFPTALHMVEEGNGWTLLPQKYVKMTCHQDSPICIYSISKDLEAYWELHMIHTRNSKKSVTKFVRLLHKALKQK
jgi:DNA-binding transcriptional LysR family regulator